MTINQCLHNLAPSSVVSCLMSHLFHSHDFNLAVSSSFYPVQPQSFLGTMHSTVAAALTQRLVKSWICCLLWIRANPPPPSSSLPVPHDMHTLFLVGLSHSPGESPSWICIIRDAW